MDRNQGGDVRIQVDFEEIDVLDIVLEVVELNFLDQRGGLVRAVDQSHHLDVVSGEDLPGVRVDHDRLRFLALAVRERREAHFPNSLRSCTAISLLTLLMEPLS